jgi:hypothetical protein
MLVSDLKYNEEYDVIIIDLSIPIKRISLQNVNKIIN